MSCSTCAQDRLAPAESSAAAAPAPGSGLNTSGWARTSTPTSITPAGVPPGTGSPKASHELASTSSAPGSAPVTIRARPCGADDPHVGRAARSRLTVAPTDSAAIAQTGSCQCRGRSTLTTAPGRDPQPVPQHRGGLGHGVGDTGHGQLDPGVRTLVARDEGTGSGSGSCRRRR